MIFVEDQSIKVNGVVLPGVVKSIEVVESAQIDEQTVEGSSTKPKQATGYEDAKINVELILDDTATQTKYQRLAVVRTLFRKSGQTVPQPVSFVNEDTAAHGISKVLFKGLTHKVESKRDQLSVTLEFLEYVPQTIKAAKKSSSSGSSGSSSSNLTADYNSYLTTERGQAPKKRKAGVNTQKSYLTKKRGQSPAVDDASSTAALNFVAQMPY